MEPRYSYSVRRRGPRGWFFDGIADLESFKTVREPVEPKIDNRRRIQSQQLADKQSANDRDPQGMPQFRTSATAQSEREATEQCRHGGHHDRTETQQRSLIDRFFWRLFLNPLGFESEVNHHDRVLFHDPD